MIVNRRKSEVGADDVGRVALDAEIAGAGHDVMNVAGPSRVEFAELPLVLPHLLERDARPG